MSELKLKKKKHNRIPVNENPMTAFLRDSLTGKSNTYLICCVNPKPEYV